MCVVTGDDAVEESQTTALLGRVLIRVGFVLSIYAMSRWEDARARVEKTRWWYGEAFWWEVCGQEQV